MNKVLSEYYGARKLHDKALRALDTKTQRIVDVIKRVFKRKSSAWWSYAYYEGDNVSLPENIEKNDDGDWFPVHISEECDTGECYYNEGFPVKFFDMTDEEIATQLRNEIAAVKDKVAKEREAEVKRQEAKNVKKNALKIAAVQKLTKEERKALGV